MKRSWPSARLYVAVMIILLVVLLCKRCQQNQKNYQDATVTARVVMYGRESCFYTRKMLKALEDANMMHRIVYVDTATVNGAMQFEQTGGRGVPYFTYNGKSATGYMEPEKLFKILQ